MPTLHTTMRSPATSWQLAQKRTLDLTPCRIMGIVNVTPDSFSDGGKYADTAHAVAHAKRLLDEGADVLDIGGESTRPGAKPVSLSQEMDRVVPVIEQLARETDALLCVDTTKAAVAQAALVAGAHIVNDISGLGFDPDMAKTCAEHDAGLVLMHIRGKPCTMQKEIAYKNLIEDILEYFEARVTLALHAGISPNAIALDPGIGFGKTLEHNLELHRQLNQFVATGHPIVFGPSRKSFLGTLLGDRMAQDRIFGTAASVACAVFKGVHVVRVHDVAQMRDVVQVSTPMRSGFDGV